MLAPAKIPNPADVARHYDELDFFYRSVWGEHVHHGVWIDENDRSSVEVATTRLLELATAPLGLRADDRVADIGCGYGGSARWIAEAFGAEVTGVTLSARQAEVAKAAPPPSRGTVDFAVRDWLDNDFPNDRFEAAVAIESLAHMPDKPRFFREVARTLVPGGRAALACWIAAPDPSRVEGLILRKICEEGRLPGMGTIADYTALAQAAGLRVRAQRDLTPEVERTWWIIARRALAGFFTDPAYLRFLANRAFREKIFVLTLPRLMLAYRTGAMRYGLLWLERP